MKLFLSYVGIIVGLLWSSIQAASPASSQLKLSWSYSNPSQVDYYVVYVSSNRQDWSPFLVTTNTSVVVSNTVEQQYFYTDAHLLPVPNYDTSLLLAWDAGADLLTYKLYYGVESRNYTNAISTDLSSALVSNLRSGTTYYFACTAISMGFLESSYSEEIHYHVADATGKVVKLRTKISAVK